MQFTTWDEKPYVGFNTKDDGRTFEVKVKTGNREFFNDLKSFIEDYRKDWEKKNSEHNPPKEI